MSIGHELRLVQITLQFYVQMNLSPTCHGITIANPSLDLDHPPYSMRTCPKTIAATTDQPNPLIQIRLRLSFRFISRRVPIAK